MLHNILIFINIGILLILSLIHFYWAFGGTWGIEHTIPEKFKEHYFNVENKSKIALATIVVALGLIAFSIIMASNYFDMASLLEKEWTIILSRIIGALFILRAIGDFNLCGIFKKNSVSQFAKKDSQVFIPLCLYLGITSILISI